MSSQCNAHIGSARLLPCVNFVVVGHRICIHTKSAPFRKIPRSVILTLNTLTIAPKDAPIGRRIRSHVYTNLDECDVKYLRLLDLTSVHSILVVRSWLPSIFNDAPSVVRSSQKGIVMPLTDCVGQYSSFGPSARLGCQLIG